LQYRYDVVLDNIVIPTGTTEDHDGLSTLTTEDVTIAGTSELKARYEVHLKPGFHATTSSECHIYTAPINLTCEEVSDAQLRSVEQTGQGNNSSHNSSRTDKEEVELNFHFEEPSFKLEVFPNPTSDQVRVQLTGSGLEGVEIWELILLNSEGKEVIARTFDGSNCTLNMASLASGAYTVVARSPGHALQQRIVKP